MVAWPADGGVRPTIIRMAVDLPAPFGPRKPVTEPGSTVNDTWSTAVKPPYRLVSSSTTIMDQAWSLRDACTSGMSLDLD